MVTGYEESLAVYNDTGRYSSCVSVTGPFPGFPVPLEGDDICGLIERHRDELPARGGGRHDRQQQGGRDAQALAA